MSELNEKLKKPSDKGQLKDTTPYFVLVNVLFLMYPEIALPLGPQHHTTTSTKPLILLMASTLYLVLLNMILDKDKWKLEVTN